MMTDDDLRRHCALIADAMLRGRVVPLLGAGVSNFGRAHGVRWSPHTADVLPDGHELALYLADAYHYDEADRGDLVRVSQYVELKVGAGPLYELLHDVFDVDCSPSALHHLLAGIPSMIRRSTPDPRYPVFLTTNYDDLLERAFISAGEEFELVTYLAESEQRGRFSHQPWGTDRHTVIHLPNEYDGFSLDRRSVILKIHGSIDRADASRDSYVATENDSLEILGYTDISGFLPAPLAPALQRNHFLFLGYRLRDWTLRVILRRIWGREKPRYASWSVQRHAAELDRLFWTDRGVRVVDRSLDEFGSVLAETLEERCVDTDGHG